MIEHGLHQVLAIIKCSVDSHSAHVRRINSCHLATLHLTDATLWVQDDDVDVCAILHAVNSCTSGVATCCSNDRHLLLTLSQDVIKQAAEQLQGNIFECKCWPVEQFHEVMARFKINYWHHIRMTKRCVRLTTQTKHGLSSNIVTHVWCKYTSC